MKLKFIPTSDADRKAKATVHSSGKLGFSTEAIKVLALGDDKFIAFAVNEESPEDMNLYGEMRDGAQDGFLKINRAGQYYFVNTKSLFDSLNIDYKNAKVIYDIAKIQYEGKEIIKFIKREVKKKQKST